MNCIFGFFTAGLTKVYQKHEQVLREKSCRLRSQITILEEHLQQLKEQVQQLESRAKALSGSILPVAKEILSLPEEGQNLTPEEIQALEKLSFQINQENEKRTLRNNRELLSVEKAQKIMLQLLREIRTVKLGSTQREIVWGTNDHIAGETVKSLVRSEERISWPSDKTVSLLKRITEILRETGVIKKATITDTLSYHQLAQAECGLLELRCSW